MTQVKIYCISYEGRSCSFANVEDAADWIGMMSGLEGTLECGSDGKLYVVPHEHEADTTHGVPVGTWGVYCGGGCMA